MSIEKSGAIPESRQRREDLPELTNTQDRYLEPIWLVTAIFGHQIRKELDAIAASRS
ncbi:MAG TPA: hypothetical protein VFQ54_12135 [Thermomicrobiales bacterium]|nr:hypothetical protein [Thermomicrobiales bacterium]